MADPIVPLFEGYFDKLEERDVRRKGTAAILGTSDPDKAAEGVQLGKELSVPPQAVMGAPDLFRGQAQQERAAKALTGAPSITQWLGDPVNGALAKDDLDNLTWFEKNATKMGRGMVAAGDAAEDTQFGRGVQTGATGIKQMGTAAMTVPVAGVTATTFQRLSAYQQVAEMDPGLARHEVADALGIDPMSTTAALAFDFLRGDEAQRQRHIDRATQVVASNEELMGALISAVETYSAQMQETAGRTPNFTDIDDISAFGDWLAFNTGQSIPFLAAVFAAGSVAGPAGALGAGYGMGVGDIRAEQLEQDIDPNDLEAGAIAMAGGVPYAAVELLGPAARPVRSVATNLFRGVQSTMARFGLNVSQQGAEEFVNEAAQEIIKDYSVQASGGAKVELNNETLTKWFNAGMAGLAGGAAFATITSAFERDVARADRSGETAARLAEIDEMAGKSKVRERSTDKFLEALQSGGETPVYVPASDMQEYFQAKDIELDEETLAAWGIDAQDFAEKVTSGGDVAVPVANYAARIAGTEDAPWFQENGVMSPDEMSVAEAQQFNERVREIIEEEREKLDASVESERAMRAADVQIYDAMFSELRAAGRSPDVAQQEATVWSAFWRTMGERYGDDPLDLARSMGVRVQGPQTPEVARRRGELDVMLNTLRSQGDRALAPRGEGVLDFVRSLGGVRDMGGDVEAMDAPKGLIAETAAQGRERANQPSLDGSGSEARGRGLDEIGRALIEAGYFPEYMGGANETADGTVVDEAAIALEAISEAIAGRERYIEGQGPDAALSALSEELQARSIDLAGSNDDIAAALEGDPNDPRILYQSAPEGDAFRKWAGTDEPVLDPDEINDTDFRGPGPYVMRAFHGTTHDFEFFDASIKGTKEGQFGAVNYFTSDAGDAGNNYTTGGPDLTNRIENMSEQLEFDVEQAIEESDGDIDDIAIWVNDTYDLDIQPLDLPRVDNDMDGDIDAAALAQQIANSYLRGGEDKVLEVYIRTEKPFVVGSDDSPFMEFVDFSEIEEKAIAKVADDEGVTVEDVESARDDYEDQIDEARWDIESDTPNALIEAVDRVATRYSFYEKAELLGQISEIAMEGTTASALEQFLRNDSALNVAEDPETGGMIGQHALAEIIQELGFDSIILKNADQRFSRMAMAPGTAHVHVFDSNNSNIKSVDNTGSFDRDDPRILYQADVEFASFKAAKEEADRLLDAIEEGGDAKAAFAAFSEVGNRREELAQAIAAEDGGIELKGAELFAAVTKSQNPDYSWRVTYFDDTGFLGHAEHKTKLEAVQSALDEGYTTEAKGALRTAMKARSFFQKYKDDKRGSVEFPRGGLRDGESVINLFESADLSTFLHESGHFFLEAFTALATADGAPAAMADDLAVIHKFLEVEDSSQIGTPQHEKWARGFEAYLMEGNAPSLELASAFARFKAWLTRIYKTVRGLNVKLTPEIREVMDRMLATDQEIAAMREDMGMRPLFTDAAPAGMSDADFATYQRMARRSAEQSEQALMKRTMEKVRRETLKWFKEEKAAVTKEVEARANKMPVYRAVEAMANGRWFDQESGEWRKLDDVDRLDRAALVDRFGEGVLAELAKTQLGGRRAIYAKGGEEPGAIAELYGFASVPDMIEALQNAGKRADYVTSEVDRIMVERHGDPLNDGSIEEAAALAVHSEQQAAMVTTEARAIAKRLGRSTRDIKAKFYKQRAKAMLGRMSVREASRPASFLQAERNAARRAERSFARVARGGRNVEQALAEAMQAKEQQILNHYLYQEARAFEQTLQRGRNRMMGYRKNSVREKLDGDYIDQIDALLERFDFRVRSGPQIERADSLEKFVDRMIEAGRETELNIDMRLIADARKTHYTRLSVDELLGLFDTITNIDHMGRRKQELIERQRRRVLDESASKVAGQIRANLTQRSTKSYNAGLRAMNLLRRPDTILVAMDEGDEIGTSYDELKRGIDEGAALEQQMQAKMADDFDALFTGHYSRKELRDMQKPQVLPGVRHEWTKQEILSLALNMGNEDNFKRVMDQNADETRRMDPQTLDALLSTLDENDWNFVQGMWTMVNSYWPDLAAVHKRRTGVEPRKVEARMMYGNAPASVTGGYFPIKYDPSLSVKAARDEESLWDRARTAGFGASAMVNNGMTKQRQATGGGRTVLYDLSVPFTHLRETTRFIALSEAVDATQRLLKHPEVAQAFMDTGNKDTLDTLQLWVEDVARGPVFNPDLLNTAFRMVKNNFTISRLAFNMKTAILQVTGLGQSAAVIGKRNMVRGIRIYARDRNAAVQDVVSMSPLMAERQSTFQKDIYDFVNQASVASPLTSGARKLRNDVAKAGFYPIVALQFYVVDMPTWLGAYAGEMQRSGDVEKARHYADRMVVRAQDSGLMADRAAIERGTLSATTRQSDVVRLFTTLGGYMLTKLNRVYVTGVQAKAGIKAEDSTLGKVAVATSAATDLTLLLAFEAALMGMIYALMSDSEDEEDVKKFMLQETGMALIGGIPLVRDAASAFRGYGAGGVYGSFLEVPARLYTQAVQGENDKAFRRAVSDLVGIATGLPSTAAFRGIEAAINDDVPLSEGLFGTNPLDR